jgi:hypothetical protein
MDTILIVLLVIIVIILVYFFLHNDTSMIPSPSPNTFSNSLPMTTSHLAEQAPVVLQPDEVLAPGYPLDEEYYYDPALFYDPYWWWGGWYGGGNRRWPHRLPSSGDIVHGGIQPGSIHMAGNIGGGGRH